MELGREVIWKPIEGFEGLYEVSSEGKVRSLNYRGIKGRIEELSPMDSGQGYLRVELCKEGKRYRCRIHRLVASAFLGNPEDFTDVNHLDEDKYNNRLNNLEWCTRKHNINHGTAIKRRAKLRSKAVEAIDPITGETVLRFTSTMEAQRSGFIASNIGNCCRGERKKHRGLYWRYV